MEKKSGWINIYNECINIEKQENKPLQYKMATKPSSVVYSSKEDAMKHIISDIDYHNKKYVDTVMIELEEKEVNPKYKTGDMVIPKVHTQEGILRGFPVEIVGIIVNQDEGISYQLRSYNNMVIKESEIIEKAS